RFRGRRTRQPPSLSTGIVGERSFVANRCLNLTFTCRLVSFRGGGQFPGLTKRRFRMTASKAELLDKLRTSADQVASNLRATPPESFEQGRYESGWNGRQILAHIASIEWTYPRLIDVAREAQSPKPAEAPKEASAEPATRAARGGINDYNGRQVEKRAQMSVAEL